MTLGEKIKAARKRKYTQEELAEILGVHPNTIVRWEHGTRVPNAEKLKAIADILGTTPSALLSSDDIDVSDVKDTEEAEGIAKIVKLPNSDLPHTKFEAINAGMLIYDLGNGKKIELPPIEASYNFLRDVAIRAAGAV